MTEQPRAQVREVDGQLVLDDSDAVAVFTAVNKHNCKVTFDMNAERIAHFVRRARERTSGPACVMVVLNVDDRLGGAVTEVLMPGQDATWQALRDSGQVPFARGLAAREPLQLLLDQQDPIAGARLRALTDVLPVIVMDHGVIEVFRADGVDI